MSAPVRAPVELEYRRSELVEASCRRTYDAVRDLQCTLGHLPDLEDIRVTTAGSDATSKIVLGPGLLDVKLDAQAHLDQVQALNLVDVTVEVPTIGTRVLLSFDLDCSAHDATLVTCTATLRSAHRRARLLRRPLMGQLERNVDVFLTNLAARISRNARAERVFERRDARNGR